MKLLLVLGILLWFLLSWFANSVGLKAAEITTNNLLNQNFDSNSWSGTADGRHGSTVIAAEHDTYIESEDISVKNDAGLTELQMQNGFTTNHEFQYWHWNTYESNVKSTVTIIGADGETTTQIRNYASDSCGSNNCGSFSGGSDTNIVLRNVQTDYDLSVRYDFTDSSNATNSHYGVDLKEPSLTITYESQPIELKVQDIIQDLFEDFTLEENIKIEEKFTFEIKEEPKIEEIFEVEESIEIVSMPEKEPEIIEEKPEVMEETMIEEKPEEEVITEKIIEEVVEEKEEEIQEEEMVEESTEQAPKKEIKTKVAKKKTKKPKIDKIMAKVDEQIKDSAKNLQIKNLIKIDAMTEDQASLSIYNVPFYTPKNIYLDQLNMFDNRLIYSNVNLASYSDNDIIGIRERKMGILNWQKNKLLLELESLKNG